MSPNLKMSVKTQMAVVAVQGPLNNELVGNKKTEGKTSGKRRVFVQTETGSVLGIELDGADNAHTVKKRLQIALNVPTEESTLSYGDMVLKNDLSSVRNDSPLLLTRKSMSRSLSSPSLSPTGSDVQHSDKSGPIEILGCSNPFSGIKHLVKDIVKALKLGIQPILICSGLGGAYYFKNSMGENIAIVKPTDEEPFAPNNPKGFVGKALGQPGLKRFVRVGETGFREVAAYLLDYDHFANVPATVLVKITHSIFNVNNDMNATFSQTGNQVSKIASLQQFVPHDFDASDHGTSSFPVSAVHRIGILDIRILNTDRHAGNLLVCKHPGFGEFCQVDLIPIDHGLCLPESLEDPYFEWIHWPQASIPFSEDELEYIDRLDPVRDSEMLRMELPMIREACLRILILCTIFLKEAAKFGLCLAEIGEMMSREFRGHEEEPSELEIICLEARIKMEKRKMSRFEIEAGDTENFQFDIDCPVEELGLNFNAVEQVATRMTFFPDIAGRNRCYQLSKLHEIKESKEQVSKKNSSGQHLDIPKLSSLLNKINLGDKSWRHQGATFDGSYLSGGTSSGNRSVNEQLPASVSFIQVGDMNEEDWMQFLEHFKKLLHPGFIYHRLGKMGPQQRQRLGTSY